MATGTPVLLSTAGSGPELVKSSVSLLVRNKLSLKEQALEWHKHIMDAIELDELRQLIEESLERRWDYVAIRDYAKSRFDASVMARNYLQLYEEIINGRYWGD
jgi:glycosyltransferase involved in cell wall biosynthesis